MTTVVSGCSKKPVSGEVGGQLIVGLTYIPDIQFSPFYVAESRNLFRDAGLDLKLRHHGQQETLMGALQTGDEHIVFAGGDEMMHARSQDVDVLNFATMYQEYPVVLIVPEDSPIQTFEDLKGRSVGLPGPFGENWYGLLAMLRDAGLNQQDLDIQNIGYTQQAALQGGKVDSVIGFINNDVVRFQNAGFPVRAIGLGQDATLVGVGLGGLTQTVQARQDELATMLGCLREAMTYINDNPDETVEIATKYVASLTTDEQKQQAKKILVETMKLYGDPAKAGSQNEAAWEKMSAFMYETNLIEKEVPAAETFTKDVVDKVK